MKEIIFILIFLTIQWPAIMLADENIKQENPSINQAEVLNSELESFNIQDPTSDLNKNIELEDYRFIGLYGYGTYYPGVEGEDYKYVIEHGSLFINGTSDVIESKEHGDLIQTAKEYAENYNKALLNYLKNPKNK